MSKLSKRLMTLHHYGKIGNNVPHFSDFLHLKITIHIWAVSKKMKFFLKTDLQQTQNGFQMWFYAGICVL